MVLCVCVYVLFSACVRACALGMVCVCACVKLSGIVLFTSGSKNHQKGYKRTILMTKMRKNLNLKVTVIVTCAVLHKP